MLDLFHAYMLYPLLHLHMYPAGQESEIVNPCLQLFPFIKQAMSVYFRFKLAEYNCFQAFNKGC